MTDNFTRHLWFMCGAGAGVAITAFLGWIAGVGWLIGYGGGGLLLYGIVTGRIVVRRMKAGR